MSDERILVVDDEPDMVENLVRILRREGYRCLSAAAATKGVLRRASSAKAAGIGRKTFHRLINKYHLK